MIKTIDNRIFYKRLWTLAFPIAFQSLMLAMVAAFDALMLGRVAQEEMTAVSLATQIQFVQNMFLMSGTAAGAILGAQYFGKGDRRTLEEIFNLMLRFCGLISALFFLACEIIPGSLMHAFTHDPVLIELGSAYLKIAGWSYLLTGISQCYLAVMKFTDPVARRDIYSYEGQKLKMRAKHWEKEVGVRPDWGEILVDALKFCLMTKWEQSEAFRSELVRTGDRFIVEVQNNSRRPADTYSAKLTPDGGAWSGPNLMGRLLMELRDKGKLVYHLPDDVKLFPDLK